MARPYLWIAGVMTGNSLDGADAVLTRFGEDGSIEDAVETGQPYPGSLVEELRELRQEVQAHSGDVQRAERSFDERNGTGATQAVHGRYLKVVAESIRQLAERAEEPIDLVGFHGQTCGHLPPSDVELGEGATYTVQLGDGLQLADLLALPVAYDFRSDDLFNGGEAAPFAPIHHRHLAGEAKRRGRFPVAFFNGGNTGNLSVISQDIQSGSLTTLGWDVGPFNHLADSLMRQERGAPFDRDGFHGQSGLIDEALLQILFDRSAVTRDGRNFLLKSPPKSSDPEWYRLPPELLGEVPLNDRTPPFRDRLRTAEYFAAYLCALALGQTPRTLTLPRHLALCGGGWKNPLVREDFEALIQGSAMRPILPSHTQTLADLRIRLNKGVTIEGTEALGFGSTAMEARIFADAAFRRVRGQPFTTPEVTGVSRPTVCGLLRFPNGDLERSTLVLRDWIERYGSLHLTWDRPEQFDPRWSRATGGWHHRLPGAGPRAIHSP